VLLRDYQQNAVDAAVEWLKKSIESCVIEAATGAGKSHVIAALAHWINDHSGKKVLCFAPSKELIEQNREKYLATGNPASIFSGSAGRKCLKHDVVFGTEKTVLNSIDKFSDRFGAIVIDECHRITPTIQKIIERLKSINQKIRVIGLTATPYRLGSGYIYRYDEKGKPVPETETRDPYFNTLIYRITAHELIEKGYLTPPHADPDVIDSYDTAGIVNHTAKEYEQAFEGKGRKTSLIVSDIVEKSRGRLGVIIFAATRQHAKEVMESLPPGNSRMLTGENGKTEREKMIEDFKAMRFKYFVNVQVLTTGFDAPHIDVVAIVRSTESVSLLQQMIGRGLRLHNLKKDCLVLDYAKNIEEHCPDGDVFNPQIKAHNKTSGTQMEVTCPICSTVNLFSMRKNPDGFKIDENGYFVDLMGQQLEPPMPAHYGRRCYGQSIIKGLGVAKRCEDRWDHKLCEDCGHENDIAARYCEECKGELVDPNEKLVIEFKRMKKDPYTPTIDKVLSWRVQEWHSMSGNTTVRVDYVTECRNMTLWHLPKKWRDWEKFCSATIGVIVDTVEEYAEKISDFEVRKPDTITAKKDKKTGYYEVLKYNEIPQ